MVPAGDGLTETMLNQILLQNIKAGTTILQVVGTFTLIWAATAGYLFRETRRYRASVIKEIDPEAENITPMTHRTLSYTTIVVWSGGIILSITILLTTIGLGSRLPTILSLPVYFMGTVVYGSTVFIISATKGKIEYLQDLGFIPDTEMRYILRTTLINVLAGFFYSCASLPFSLHPNCC